MSNVKRALSTIAVSAVVTSGLVGGAVVSADAHPARPATAVAQRDLLELIPLELPDLSVLSGLGEVGTVLSLTEPVWNLLGVTDEVQWLRDGVPIEGATDLLYTVTEADAGTELSALVTGSLLGALPLSLITNAIGIPLLGEAGSTPVATAAPKINVPGPGTEAKVGKLLTSTAPTWSPSADSTTYQWLRAGTPISGATGTTYTVAPEDVGKAITLKATGNKSGATAGTSTSSGVTGVLGDAISATTQPSIAGNGNVGALLSVAPGTWSGSGASPTFSYQWLRNGSAILGETGSTYVAQAADAGRTLTVRVAASRSGYAPGSATTSGLAIKKMSTKTVAALVKKTVKAGTNALLKITLKGSGAQPSGAVKVYDGSKLLKKYSIRSSDNGKRTVKLPKLKAGTHKIKAKYAGGTAFIGSTSKVVTLKVTK